MDLDLGEGGPRRNSRPPVATFEIDDGLDNVFDMSDIPLFHPRREQRDWKYWLFGWPTPRCNSYNLCTCTLLFILLIACLSLAGEIRGRNQTFSEDESLPFDPFQHIHLETDFRNKPRRVEVQKGVVAADHGRCSDMGRDILKMGGNAVDAAVTTALCQGIMNPMASGVGGGGFILIRLSNGTAKVVDARETAPANASTNMYAGLGKYGSTIGGKAIAIPLELKGLELAHKEFGKLPWETLLQPAIDLAQNGFEAHPYFVRSLSSPLIVGLIMSEDGMREAFLVQDNGTWRAPRVGEVCCGRPALAETLRQAAENGVDFLYKGEWGEKLAADIQGANMYPGVITAEDLQTVEATLKDPVRATVFGMEALIPPPPSSGAVILMALKILGKYDWSTDVGLLEYHRLVEVFKHVFAVRTNLGDPGPNNKFLNLTQLLKDVISDEFTEELRGLISDDGVLDLKAYGGEYHANFSTPQDRGTTHFCVVDSERNAVSMTTTVNGPFGSFVLSKSTGLLLNNQMDDFSRPDMPNEYSLPPSKPNFIKPGKKPLSSMSPVMFVKDGELREVLGGSGGPLIITSIIQTAFRSLQMQWDPADSVFEGRLHHQLAPDHVYAEQSDMWGMSFKVNEKTVKYLTKKGNQVDYSSWHAINQVVMQDLETKTLTAVSDARKDGAPAGY